MNTNAKSPEDRLAGTFLLWVVLHILLCVVVLTDGPTLIAVPALLVYGLCVLRMNGLLCAGGRWEDLRLMRNYWLAAGICMVLWLFWIEPKLAGNGGVIETLLLSFVIPYATNLSCEFGWACDLLPRRTCRACQYVLLALCVGQLAYVLWLSGRAGAKRKEARHGPVDPGAGTVE